MHLLYIDESGTTKLKKDPSLASADNGNSKYFVMAGVLINTRNLEKIEIELLKLKNEYLKDPFQELKTTLKGRDMKSDKQRSDFIREIYELISNSELFCFGAQLNKYELTKTDVVKSKDDIYQLAFEHLLGSVNDFITMEAIDKSITVMIDNVDRTHNKKIYREYKNALDRKQGKLKSFSKRNFSPSINFVESEFTLGVQLADFVAGAMWRSIEKQQRENAALIKQKFPINKDGELFDYSYKICMDWI